MRWCLWIILFATTGLNHMANETTFRTWTDMANRQIEAKFEAVEGTEVQLRLRNGQVVKVPIGGLSENDQAWILEWKNQSEDPYDGPPAEEDWPRNVNPSDNPTAEVISEDEEKAEFIYESENYRFVSDIQLSTSLVREFSEVFETTLLVNSLLPLNLRPIPEPGREKFVARIYRDPSEYEQVVGITGTAGVYSMLEREMRLPITSLGVKQYGDKLTMDYNAENFATLIHEITHQSMNRWLARMPIWLIEGTAEYIELAEYDNGRFTFWRQDDRLSALLANRFGSPFRMLNLKRLMTLSPQAWGAAVQAGAAPTLYMSSLVMTYYFYHLDGEEDAKKIRAYFVAAEKMQRGDSIQALISEYLLRGRTYAELEEEVVKAFRGKGIKIEFIEFY